MRVCTHYRSAIQAAPQLWPTVVLAVPLHGVVTPVRMGDRYESRMVRMAHTQDSALGQGLSTQQCSSARRPGGCAWKGRRASREGSR